MLGNKVIVRSRCASRVVLRQVEFGINSNGYTWIKPQVCTLKTSAIRYEETKKDSKTSTHSDELIDAKYLNEKLKEGVAEAKHVVKEGYEKPGEKVHEGVKFRGDKIRSGMEASKAETKGSQMHESAGVGDQLRGGVKMASDKIKEGIDAAKPLGAKVQEGFKKAGEQVKEKFENLKDKIREKTNGGK